MTLLNAASKDELGAMLSEGDADKWLGGGDFSVALSSEDILPEYTIRTMKVRFECALGCVISRGSVARPAYT